MNIDAASPPLVYAFTHPLGLAHNPVPFARVPPQDPPLQITATMVATTLTVMIWGLSYAKEMTFRERMA